MTLTFVAVGSFMFGLIGGALATLVWIAKKMGW